MNQYFKKASFFALGLAYLAGSGVLTSASVEAAPGKHHAGGKKGGKKGGGKHGAGKHGGGKKGGHKKK